MFSKIAASQNSIIIGNVNAKYSQCLISPESDKDGASLTAFDRTRKPTQGNDWTNILTALDVAGGTRCQYYCHVYKGPQGQGYIMGARVVWDHGRVWIYREHVGPEKRSGTFNAWWEQVEY